MAKHSESKPDSRSTKLSESGIKAFFCSLATCSNSDAIVVLLVFSAWLYSARGPADLRRARSSHPSHPPWSLRGTRAQAPPPCNRAWSTPTAAAKDCKRFAMGHIFIHAMELLGVTQGRRGRRAFAACAWQGAGLRSRPHGMLLAAATTGNAAFGVRAGRAPWAASKGQGLARRRGPARKFCTVGYEECQAEAVETEGDTGGVRHAIVGIAQLPGLS